MTTRRPIALVGSLLTLAAAFSWSCASDDEEKAGATKSALNGTVSYSPSCTPTEQDTLAVAMGKLVKDVHDGGGAELRGCLKDAFLSPPSVTAEEVMVKMQQNLVTHIECVNFPDPSTNGYALIGIADERIQISKDHIHQSGTNEIAGTIAHELAHNKGYGHWSGLEYGYGIPEQIEQCVTTRGEDGGRSAGGPARSKIARETELQKFGGLTAGDAGVPFDLGCGANQYMVAAALEVDATAITGLTMRCESGAGVLSELSVGAPAATFNSCAAGSVVVGVEGFATPNVNQLAFKCAPTADVLAGITTTSTLLPSVGTATGYSVERSCPAGMAVKSLFGNIGAHLQELRLACQTLGLSPLGGPVAQSALESAIATAGTDRGSYRTVCSGRSAMISLYGRGLKSAPATVERISRLGAECLPLENDAGVLLVSQTSGPIPLASVGHGEEPGDFDFREAVPLLSNYALVGLKAGYAPGGEITYVQGRYANSTAWVGAGAVTIDTLALAGFDHANEFYQVDCPRGKFLIGLETTTLVLSATNKRALVKLVPYCR